MVFSVEISLKVRGNILLGASLLAIGLLLACRSTAAPLQMTLKIAPDHPTMTSPMTFTLHITDDHGQPVNDATVNGALPEGLAPRVANALSKSPVVVRWSSRTAPGTRRRSCVPATPRPPTCCWGSSRSTTTRRSWPQPAAPRRRPATTR